MSCSFLLPGYYISDLVPEGNEGLLLEQILPDVGDVLTIVGAVVTSSGPDVRAVSFRTERHHSLVYL